MGYTDLDMDTADHIAELEAFIAPRENRERKLGQRADRDKALEAALYAFGELGLWGADIKIDPQLAIRIWAVVETVHWSGFPGALRM